MKALLWISLATLNILLFIFYGVDKFCAIKNKARISERTLHLLAFLGGSPAAFLAQHVFRHKTRKASFQTIFWVTVIVQATALTLYWRYIRS